MNVDHRIARLGNFGFRDMQHALSDETLRDPRISFCQRLQATLAVALNAGDGNTLAIAAVPKLSNHRLRFSLFNSSSRSFHLMERAEFLFGTGRLIFDFVLYRLLSVARVA